MTASPAVALLSALLLCLCYPPILASDTSFDPEQLKACYRQPPDAVTTLSFDEYMAGLPSRLHLHSVLEVTPAQDVGTSESILTVVTALNAARLDSLVAQCHSWPGQAVAALYAPIVRPAGANADPALSDKEARGLDKLQDQARSTITEAQGSAGSCRLRVLLLYEFVDSDFLAALIPINALRNVALLGATTPLVAMIDVDLLISSNLGQQLVTGDAQLKESRSEQVLRKCQKERAALILPAFQTPKNRSNNGYPQGEELQRSIELVQQLAKGNKTAVQRAVRSRELIKFASQQFSIGHRRTDFPRWFETTVWYPVDFIAQFEPWYIVDRLHTPFYDVNFRGYGRNKQQQAAHASSVGMEFWVHPDAFLIHMPHDKSEAQKDHDATWVNHKARQAARASAGIRPGKKASNDRAGRLLKQAAQGHGEAGVQEAESQGMPQGLQHVRRVDKLFRQFVRQMPVQAYQTLLDPAALACLGKLPWWRGSSVPKWSTVERNQ